MVVHTNPCTYILGHFTLSFIKLSTTILDAEFTIGNYN
jgi:hypothetical protein